MFHVIIWTLIGCLVMAPIGKPVSKLEYFCCWFMLMACLVEKAILK